MNDGYRQRTRRIRNPTEQVESFFLGPKQTSAGSRYDDKNKGGDDLGAVDFWEGVTVISELLGQTVTEISGAEAGFETLRLTYDAGLMEAVFSHDQTCCEDVKIAQVDGDPKHLIGSPLTMAEVVSEELGEPKPSKYSDSWTWSFLKLATVKGYVTVRWLGESNGYYGESISMLLIPTGLEIEND